MTTEECAICGNTVPFGSTAHVMLNPKHVDGIADHYVCRPCYDEHLDGLFATLEEDVALVRDDDGSAPEDASGEGDVEQAEPVGES